LPRAILSLLLAPRQQPLVGWPLRERRAEFAIDEPGLADLARAIVGQHPRGKVLRESERRQVRIVDPLMSDLVPGAAQMVKRLAPDGVKLDLHSVALGAPRFVL